MQPDLPDHVVKSRLQLLMYVRWYAGAGSPPGVMSADRGAGVSEEGLRLREAHQQISHLELSLVQVHTFALLQHCSVAF